MNLLYQFTIQKEEETVVKEQSVNDKNETITIERKVKTPVPHVFSLKRDNRGLRDKAELFFASKVSEAVKEGVLQQAMIEKAIREGHGILTKEENEDFATAAENWVKTELELAKLKEKVEQTEEDKAKVEELSATLKQSREKVTSYRFKQQELFSQSAEALAINRLILWWMLNLAHKKNAKGEFEPLFAAEDYEKKLAEYDRLSELNDEFWNKVLAEFTYLATFLVNAKGSDISYSNEEQFTKAYKEVLSRITDR